MALTFPQHGDEPDAAFFATLAGFVPGPGFLVNGFGFTVDYTTPALDVAAGKGFVVLSTMATASSEIDPAKEVTDAIHVVEFDGETGIALTDGAVNEIYLNANVGTDDSPTIAVDPAAVGDEMLKIGEVDTANDAASERWYLVAQDGTLTFPDEAALDATVAGLRPGTLVYDRGAGEHYQVTSGGGRESIVVSSGEIQDAAIIWSDNFAPGF